MANKITRFPIQFSKKAIIGFLRSNRVSLFIILMVNKILSCMLFERNLTEISACTHSIEGDSESSRVTLLLQLIRLSLCVAGPPYFTALSESKYWTCLIHV
jgi:hypothetical protein